MQTTLSHAAVQLSAGIAAKGDGRRACKPPPAAAGAGAGGRPAAAAALQPSLARGCGLALSARALAGRAPALCARHREPAASASAGASGPTPEELAAADAAEASDAADVQNAMDKGGEMMSNLASMALKQERELGPDHPDLANSLEMMGTYLAGMRRVKEALPFLERALAIREKVYGPSHEETAASLLGLAKVLLDSKRAEEAAPLMKRAVSALEVALGPDHPDLGAVLSNTGVVYLSLGRDADALPFIKRGVALREKALGPDSEALVGAYETLGKIHRRMGQMEEALPMHARALAILEKAKGASHPALVGPLHGLATLRTALKQPTEALPLYERACGIADAFQASSGGAGPIVAVLAVEKGNTQQELGRPQEALASFGTALGALEALVEAEGREFAHMQPLDVMLGGLDRTPDGALKAALPLYTRALAVVGAALGPEHPNGTFLRARIAAVEKKLAAAA